MQTQKKIDHILTQIDHFFWPSTETIDVNTKVFFVFKPYPKHLKRNQIEQWAILQCKSLSPFTTGDHYQYLSKAGLHLWISQTDIHGKPETALQASLSNGSHMVAGKKHLYQQTWSDGFLINCLILDKSLQQQTDFVLPLVINQVAPWAVTRKIDRQLKTPSTWLAFSLFVLLCGAVWHTAGFLTLNMQYQHAEQSANDLQQELGEQLARQDLIQRQQKSLTSLQTWQSEFGFLPETFAAIVEKLNQLGTWQGNSIVWQSRTLVIELVAKELDIAALVAELEEVDSLAKVNIRPHISNDTWILEATLK
jgi:hypothetical protein